MSKNHAKTVSSDTSRIPTTLVWDIAHRALWCGDIAKARGALDTLARRDDNPHTLLNSVSEYERVGGWTCHDHFRAILQDRLELVNARAEERWGL